MGRVLAVKSTRRMGYPSSNSHHHGSWHPYSAHVARYPRAVRSSSNSIYSLFVLTDVSTGINCTMLFVQTV